MGLSLCHGCESVASCYVTDIHTITGMTDDIEHWISSIDVLAGETCSVRIRAENTLTAEYIFKAVEGAALAKGAASVSRATY
jgi:hypothetical protein